MSEPSILSIPSASIVHPNPLVNNSSLYKSIRQILTILFLLLIVIKRIKKQTTQQRNVVNHQLGYNTNKLYELSLLQTSQINKLENQTKIVRLAIQRNTYLNKLYKNFIIPQQTQFESTNIVLPNTSNESDLEFNIVNQSDKPVYILCNTNQTINGQDTNYVMLQGSTNTHINGIKLNQVSDNQWVAQNTSTAKMTSLNTANLSNINVIPGIEQILETVDIPLPPPPPPPPPPPLVEENDIFEPFSNWPSTIGGSIVSKDLLQQATQTNGGHQFLFFVNQTNLNIQDTLTLTINITTMGINRQFTIFQLNNHTLTIPSGRALHPYVPTQRFMNLYSNDTYFDRTNSYKSFTFNVQNKHVQVSLIRDSDDNFVFNYDLFDAFTKQKINTYTFKIQADGGFKIENGGQIIRYGLSSRAPINMINTSETEYYTLYYNPLLTADNNHGSL